MRSLTVKFSLILLAASLTGILLAALGVWYVITREFDDFVVAQAREQFASDMAGAYLEYGSWELVPQTIPAYNNNPNNNGQNNQPPNNTGNPNNGGNNPPPNNSVAPPLRQQDNTPARFALIDADKRVIIDFDRYKLGEIVKDRDIESARVLEVDGEVIGYIITTDRSQQRETVEKGFLTVVNRILFISGGVALVIALVLGSWLSRLYTRPLRELTHAVHGIRSGDYSVKVPVRSKDEVGILAESVNQMSAEIDRAHQLRKQMTADIAHEFRTPLTVISGYLESLRDGVLKPTTERFTTVYDEALLLQRLVEDLRTLSLADAGELSLNLQTIDANQLAARVQSAYQATASQQSVEIMLETTPRPASIRADLDRLLQVMGNLVSNALRYTPADKHVSIKTMADANQVFLIIEDEGQGISPEHLTNIFERFYQVDEAHTRSGQSGLGLAIARSIVEAHQGTIHVESQLGQGTRFTISLPSV